MEQRPRDRADRLSPTGAESGRAIVIEPWLKHAARGESARAAADTRTPEARLEEAAGLARAIDLNVVQAGLVTLNAVRPATYIGTGKVEEIAGLVKSLDASVVVIVPQLTRRTVATGEGGSHRGIEARLEEAIGLAKAIGLIVASAGIVPLSAIRPATFLGKGKVEEIAGIVRAEEAGLVFVDTALSPVQQRNLEKAWNAKVVDRTGLILEIFGQRARTKEGTLQVELAHGRP